MAHLKAKTIQIFLPEGNPLGIRVAQEMESPLIATLIPRASFQNILEREYIDRYGIYFLIGDEDDDKQVYVGQSDNCLRRIKEHNRNPDKDFWLYAIIINAKHVDHWSASHTNYLEACAIQKIKALINDASAYYLVNKKEEPINEASLDESTRSRLKQNFELIDLLLSTLGFSLFKPLRHINTDIKREAGLLINDEINNATKTNKLFYCRTTKGVEAIGEYSDAGFIVHQGSRAAIKETQSIGLSGKKMREKLIESELMKKTADNKFYFFSKNKLFTSPSSAATAVLGRESNGWTDWKNSEGRTLSDIFRS